MRSPARAGTTGDAGAPETASVSAGGLVVRGHGLARVTATGVRTRLGQIGARLAEAEEPPTPLQRATRRLIGVLGVAALAMAGLTLVAYGVLRGNWIEGTLAALTLGIALIPEEFPMVLAVFLALGGWRLARGQILVRRMAAIEALGAISVLCVDKTGTLTVNRMDVAAVWAAGPGDVRATDAAGRRVVEAALLASALQPLDPMDRALHAIADGWRPPGAPLRSHPLRPERLAFIQTWPADGGSVRHAAKGAPEAVFALCRLEGAERAAAEAAVVDFGRRGLRVLGVATAHAAQDVDRDPDGEAFVFEGLVAFADPVRKDVPPALAAARAAGIEVVMITGDFSETALAIARDAGVDARGGVLTGAELQALDDNALGLAVRTVRVFARVSPDQKLRLVRALQANGERVGMFGDGVNDAPALEAAEVGVAMGQRGTDVAREASDIVLLDDRFASVVSGIAEGRRIYENLRAALAYLVVVHVPMAGLALAPPLIGAPAVLFPMQVVLLELVIDPICALVFESRPPRPDLMRQAPRSASASLLSRRRFAGSLALGAVLLAASLGAHLVLLAQGAPATEARAGAFILLVAGNLGVAGVLARSGGVDQGRQGPIFAAIAALAVAAVGAALYLPPIAQLFEITSPPPIELAILVGAGAVIGLAVGAAGRIGLRGSA